MKKLFTYILTLALFCGQMSAYAEADAVLQSSELLVELEEAEVPQLNFTPKDGGTFIYCNNPESILREHLSDVSNPEPEYLMSNHNMPSGRYSVYISQLNHTEKRAQDGTFAECGFDIEVDFEITALTDTELTINALGFETAGVTAYYEDGVLKYNESDWGCMQAVADFMGRTIHTLNSTTEYVPKGFEPVTISIKKGQSFWLSSVIDGYRAVGWLKPVQILADLEITKGSVDMNVAALRSNGDVGDRSHHAYNAADGRYYPTKNYKGVAKYLPEVYSDELVYNIDDSIPSGTNLNVIVTNQSAPEGKELSTWYTHLNPQADPWSSALCAESDMLPLEYKDRTKLSYYGGGVFETEKSDVWYFDTKHSDTREYVEHDGVIQGFYEPNYRIPDGTVDPENAGNLGNYGVFENYVITVNNSGDRTRYFNYQLTTTSNNVVSVKNMNNEYVGDYSLSKGAWWEKRTDTLASVELPPNSTTSFIIEVLLPMNYPGGMANSFVLSEEAASLAVIRDDTLYKLDNSGFTGKEFYEWTADGDIKTSYDGENWTVHKLSDSTKALFDGKRASVEIISAGDGYMARSSDYQSSVDSYYMAFIGYYNSVYFLDSGFDIVGDYNFGEYPQQIAYSLGRYYVRTKSGVLWSDNGNEWHKQEAGYMIPADNGSRYALTSKDSKFYLTEDGTDLAEAFYPFAEEKTVPEATEGLRNPLPENTELDAPLYAEAFGEYYVYSQYNTLFVSRDGLTWTAFDAKAPVKTFEYEGKQGIINGNVEIDLSDVKEYTLLRINDRIMSTRDISQIENDRLLVSARSVCEALGAKLFWNGTERSVTVYNNADVVKFVIDSNDIILNGQRKTTEIPPRLIEGKTMLPLRTLADCLDAELIYNDGVAELYKTNSFDSFVGYPDAELPDGDVITTGETAIALARVILGLGDDVELTAEYNSVTGCYEVAASDDSVKIIIKSKNAEVVSIRTQAAADEF